MRHAALDTLLQNAVATGAVPGVVAMATVGEDTIYEGAFGEKSLGGGAKMQKDTVFWIASMTQAITAARTRRNSEPMMLPLIP